MTLEVTNDNFYGVLLLAVVFSAVLYGIGVLQFWLYMCKYHSTDPILVKSVVTAVIFCDTCQQVLLTHAIYRTLVTVTKFKFDSLLPTNHMLETLVIVTNTLSAAVDVMISVILISLLYSEKTEFHTSTDIIKRLIVFAFTTGLPTTVFALLTAVSTAAFSNTLLYLFFYILLGKLYTNSLLVTLNSRDYIKFGGSNGVSGKQYSLELEIPSHSRILAPQSHLSRDAIITVRIETDTVHDFNREDLK
ncbi:hypothetical protein C8R44DRAFT_974330 [Mycena epipterygia]|nr:hypothetical protein C8R44DRAFT_974330 [Mycena epipterygia]